MDGMTIDDAKTTCVSTGQASGPTLEGTYQPQSVSGRNTQAERGQKARRDLCRRQTDPQALPQVLQERWDPTFSTQLRLPTWTLRSSGGSPGTTYVAEGYSYVVDLDLEKFSTGSTYQLMGASLRGVRQACAEFIRACLKRVMEDGLVRPVDEGTPQAVHFRPLSNSCSTISTRNWPDGSRFCRYADDCTSMFAAGAPGNGDGLGEPVPDWQAAAEGQ